MAGDTVVTILGCIIGDSADPGLRTSAGHVASQW